MELVAAEASATEVRSALTHHHTHKAKIAMFEEMIQRRQLLQSMAAMGLSLSLPSMTPAQAQRRRDERPKSLITLWMNGGMSQLETFDPHFQKKLSASDQVRSIDTNVPGLQISHFMPRMAEQMDKVTLIRSMKSPEGDHARGAVFVKTGYRPDPTLNYPSLGAILASQLPDDAVEIPQHVALGTDQFFPRGGYLGNKWDAFRVFDPGRSLTNLKSGVTENRQQLRKQGLDKLAERFRQGRPTADRATLHQSTVERALRMMSSEQLKAFELDEEPAQVKASYGDSRFGRGCLIARRLVEVGVRAVEVSLNGFDTHVNNLSGQQTQADQLDPAMSTLLQDLHDRDLLDSTIVLCITEFGRTPTVNAAGGRDHWPHWFSAVVAGGGFRSGLVVGETPAALPERAKDQKPAEAYVPVEPIFVPQLYATILHAMGLEWDEEMVSPIGRPIRLTDQGPLPQLLNEKLAASVRA